MVRNKESRSALKIICYFLLQCTYKTVHLAAGEETFREVKIVCVLLVDM